MPAYIMIDALRFAGSLLCCQPEGAWAAGTGYGSFKFSLPNSKS